MASGEVPESVEPGPIEFLGSTTDDGVQLPKKEDVITSSAEPAATDDGPQPTCRDEAQEKPSQSVGANPDSSAGEIGVGQLPSSPVERSSTPPTGPPTQRDRPEGAQISEATSASQLNPAGKEPEESGPSLAITLLLTTGARHPFKIDGKYLRKRGTNVENNDPFKMSVYNLKELIWREWRPEWEQRPSSPSSIRLIWFGKLLDDKAPLSDSRLNRDAPNVIHMTVKPQEIVDEEDAKGSKAYHPRERDLSERSPRCRCIIL